MSLTLLVTVGGSHSPIDTAIRDSGATSFVFICSDNSRKMVDGDGKPIEWRRGDTTERLESFVRRFAITADHYDILELKDLDNLADSYCQIYEKIQSLRDAGRASLVADYTGGTKTMSASLALACVDAGVALQLTTGPRLNLVKVDREEMSRGVSVSAIRAQRSLYGSIRQALAEFNYSGALTLLSEVLRPGDLPAKLRSKLLDTRSWAMALEAWDRFDHGEAAQALGRLKSNPQVLPYALGLNRITGADHKKAHGYELVEDLMLNAHRRAARKSYDDAVGRLYRALEMLAQQRLLIHHRISTSALEIDALPADFRATLHPGQTQIGLDKAYRLLIALGDEPVGQTYQQRQSQITGSLQVRNYSLFAHGNEPVDAAKYQRFYDAVGTFLEVSLDGLRPPKAALKQFPTSIEF